MSDYGLAVAGLHCYSISSSMLFYLESTPTNFRQNLRLCRLISISFCTNSSQKSLAGPLTSRRGPRTRIFGPSQKRCKIKFIFVESNKKIFKNKITFLFFSIFLELVGPLGGPNSPLLIGPRVWMVELTWNLDYPTHLWNCFPRFNFFLQNYGGNLKIFESPYAFIWWKNMKMLVLFLDYYGLKINCS